MQDHNLDHIPKKSKSAKEGAEDIIQIVQAYLE
jgi:hypothetical protein